MSKLIVHYPDGNSTYEFTIPVYLTMAIQWVANLGYDYEVVE